MTEQASGLECSRCGREYDPSVGVLAWLYGHDCRPVAV